MIQLNDVSKVYGSREHPIRALDQVNLHVESGAFVALSGPSGSGKSTLLNIICGLQRPDRGQVLVNNKDLFSQTDAQCSFMRARLVGSIYQFSSLLPALTVLENIWLPNRFSNTPVDSKYIEDLLAFVGLTQRQHALPEELSFGQQRRVAVVRALATQPKILLCDEPTSDLDPDNSALILQLIGQSHKNGTTVILATHQPDHQTNATVDCTMSHGRLTTRICLGAQFPNFQRS